MPATSLIVISAVRFISRAETPSTSVTAMVVEGASKASVVARSSPPATITMPGWRRASASSVGSGAGFSASGSFGIVISTGNSGDMVISTVPSPRCVRFTSGIVPSTTVPSCAKCIRTSCSFSVSPVRLWFAAVRVWP